MVDFKTSDNEREALRKVLPDAGEKATLIHGLWIGSGDEEDRKKHLKPGTVITIEQYSDDLRWVQVDFRGNERFWSTTLPFLAEAIGPNWREHHTLMMAVNNPNQNRLPI